MDGFLTGDKLTENRKRANLSLILVPKSKSKLEYQVEIYGLHLNKFRVVSLRIANGYL